MRLNKVFMGISWRPVASYFFLLILFLGILKLYAVEKISVAGAAAIAVPFAVGLAWVLFKRVISPLNEIAEAAEEMARGNLNRELKIYSQDEIGNLARSINGMAEKLKGTIAEISRERNRAKAILDSIADGVVAVDKTGRVILINPVVEELLQTRQQDVQGKKIIEVIPNRELENIFSLARESKRSVTREIRLMLPEPGIFKVQATPLEGAGQEEGGVVAILRDITERKKLEQMRTDFVANVSHELRTPLTSIHGFLETLLDGAMDDKETTKYFLELMSVETRRLTKLTNDLMDLSKIEELKTIQWQEVSVPEVIERVITIFRTLAEEKNLIMFDDIKGDLPPVKSDPDLLAQVLMNLVDNAIKFTPREGQVTVRAIRWGKHVKIDVVDTGPGIPKESLPRIFERFYRVDKSRARDLGGMGLGLAIVKHVVKAINGQITVDSREGQGSVFSLYIPVCNFEKRFLDNA
jgi:two-component system phosphate regulon sensor histidine kinase PhoR